MIYSGIDWSEEVNSSVRVFAIVHIDSEFMPSLDEELARVRTRTRRPEDYAFKHVASKPDARREFFLAMRRVPTLRAHVLICDKTFKNAQFQGIRIPKGDVSVWHGIATLIVECPDDVLDDRIILIDLPRGEMPTVVAYRTALRKALKIARKPPVRDLRPRPDDRLDGAIVQVADMIAGEVRELGGLDGPHLPGLSTRIRSV